MKKQKKIESESGYYTGNYLAGKSIKSKEIVLPHPEKVWILEYYYEAAKKWLYVEKGKGVPFGPWKMEQAIYEMNTWAKSTANKNPKWVKDGAVEWRIRNVETGEIVPQSIFGPGT